MDMEIYSPKTPTPSQPHILTSRPSMDLKDRVVPYEFTFSKYTDNPKDWCSRSFYTHALGYRMCVEVAPQGKGEGEGTHVSVYIYLKKGDNDDNLPWPFRGDITIQLLNRLGRWCHHEMIIRFNKKTPVACCERYVTEIIMNS